MIGNIIVDSLANGKLSVLLFHKVPHTRHPLCPSELDLREFELTICYLKDNFQILPLADAIKCLKGKIKLPKRAACITFDDGYPDWEHGVVPLLLKHKLPATFFISAGQFLGQPMWNERILHALENFPANVSSLNLSFLKSPLALDTISDRKNAISILENSLKYLSTSKREELLIEIEAALPVCLTNTPRMTEQQLRFIHSKGFEIGAHTVGHPILSCCTDEDAREEICASREILSGITGSQVQSFAYPNGRPSVDFLSKHVDMVRLAGYSYAVTTGTGAARSGNSVFQIPRFTPWGPTPTRRSIQIARNILARPLEVSESEQEFSSKRVLMVAFHFPPQAGSSGILRTLNFVRYLPKSGWKPVVLTANTRAYESTSDDLLKSIPTDTEVVRGFALDAPRHLGIRGKYPQFLSLPDRWSSWWGGGVIAGLRAIKQHRIEVIWSTYPIATSHMIAATLAKITGLPWVADFRDPMVGNPSYQFSALQRRVVGRLETLVMKRAASCVFTTERAAQKYRDTYPTEAAKCYVIENGYDDEVFTTATPTRDKVDDDCLLLLHSGIIYPGDRDPTAFFAATSRLLEDGSLDKRKLCIRFRAPLHGDEVYELALSFGLGDVVDIAPPISYQAAVEEMLGADVLLVFQGAEFNSQIPAKIYEYLCARRLIFGIVDLGGDTAARLKQFSATTVVDINNKHDIENGFRKIIRKLTSDCLLQELENDNDKIASLSRSRQTVSLANVFAISSKSI